MKLPKLFRPFDRDDFMGLAGATPLPGAPENYRVDRDAAKFGPFIADAVLRHDKVKEEVSLIVCGSERKFDLVSVSYILAQGDPLSLSLDDDAKRKVGAVELVRDGLTVEQAEELLTVLTNLPSPINVTVLTAMGFEVL
jgi:hypothetical protein